MRKYPRFVYDRPAKIKLGDKEYDCVVHDISAGGALIMASLPVQGRRYRLPQARNRSTI